MDMSRQQSCNSCSETNGARQTNNEMTNRCGYGSDFGRNGFFPRPMGRMNGMPGACGYTSPSNNCDRKPMKPCQKEHERNCSCSYTSPSNNCCRKPMDPCQKERERSCGCGCTSPSNDCGRKPMKPCQKEHERSCGCGYTSPSNDCNRKPMDPCRKERNCGCGDTSPSNNCGCDKTDCFTKRNAVDNMQIGMAYVPWQEYENVWDSCDGFKHGTIFEDLALPFKCDQCCKR